MCVIPAGLIPSRTVEERLGSIETRVAVIEATLPHLATKAELYRVIGLQTLALLGAITGIMFGLLKIMLPVAGSGP